MRVPGGVRLGRAVSGFSLFVVVVLALLLPTAAVGQMAGSVHDFVDDGFTGGGVCAECHVPHLAGDVRLWPRPVPVGTAPDKLCVNCHYLTDPTPPGDPPPTLNTMAAIFSSEAAWAAVTNRPRAVPFSHGAAFTNCTRCHQH